MPSPSALTRLAYIPVNDAGFKYQLPASFEAKKLAPNYGIDVVAAGLPQDSRVKKAILATVKGKLVAWDPVEQKAAWTIERAGPWNGGTLATGGNLVFEGTASANFDAYRASNGEKLWSFPAQTGVLAGPVTYKAGREQYVAVLAGWGGVFPLAAGEVSFASGRVPNISRMLVFKLGGKANLSPTRAVEPLPLTALANPATPRTIRRGERLFQSYCAGCHGDVAVSGGVLPDLRRSSALADDSWFEIVLRGDFEAQGMVSFSKELSREDAGRIRSYVIFRRNQDRLLERR